VEISRAPAVESPLVEFDPEPMVTQRVIESPTPIDDSENKKLESYVNKTIVNDNNVVDVPVFQEKDKMLEEVRKMISEPQPELTTVMVSSIETTTYQSIPETSTEQLVTTTQQTEEPTKPSTVPVTFAPPPPETETIFIPISSKNNENIKNYEEKLSIETTTMESTTTSQPVSLLWIDFLDGSKRVVNYIFQWTFHCFMICSERRKLFFRGQRENYAFKLNFLSLLNFVLVENFNRCSVFVVKHFRFPRNFLLFPFCCTNNFSCKLKPQKRLSLNFWLLVYITLITCVLCGY
jgi:hypothetical protein